MRRVSSVTRRLRGRRVTTEVSCAEYFPVRDKALRAHASQVDPSGPFFLVPWTWRQQLWPTEKFELAHAAATVAGCTAISPSPLRRLHIAASSA
ncbi:1D-myo-inositol 2-acetamido-2-deoxy-alpha-D-glucopyranoside deacetylase [Mycobacteroides abscessus subsp. massiliense]|nr:1D-myo-inositol 2-acetamido-2-deoxy-alpha-D-glucopyranoside deacetylase [Mycobacteroides abscessus subsp. massiliense]